MDVCVLQQVEFVLYYPQKVFNLPNVLVNVIFMTILWSFLYVTSIKFFEVILKKFDAQNQFRKLFLNSVWYIWSYLLVISISGIFLLTYSLGDDSSAKTNFHTEIIFPVICAFLLHRLYLLSKLNGLDSSTVRWLIAAGAFSLSYGARCLGIGVRFVLIWSVTALIIEAISLALNITEILWKKRLGIYVSTGIMSFFCLIWASLYLYIYPYFVLLPVTSLNITHPPVSLISLLLLALWGEFLLDVCTSPVGRLLWMVAIRSFPPNWLGSIFMPHRDDLKEKLLLIRRRAKEKEEKINNHIQSEDVKRSGPKNSQAVIQTIRCVLLLKKKLRRMRDKKNLEQNSSTQCS